MTLHKICKAIDYSSQAWRDYCHWRNHKFTMLESLDSMLRDTVYECPEHDTDWQYTLTIDRFGGIVTDVINDDAYAIQLARRLGGEVILNFDYQELEVVQNVIGYDILDGDCQFSLLTNFGNDIPIVNRYLTGNGLILLLSDVLQIHAWFLEHMPNDGHVGGSRIFAVYPSTTLI